MNKKSMLFALLPLFCCLGLGAQNINIPDVNFKNALVNSVCADMNDDDDLDDDVDTNNDGEIQLSEALAVKRLSVNNRSILSLAGIEHFAQLRRLFCSSNKLTTLDVQGLDSLRVLYCFSNKLTSLGVQGLSHLQDIFFANNQLATVELAGLDSLKTLVCYSNKLTTLMVQGLSNLVELNCEYNELTSLDVHGLSKFNTLSCAKNQLISLNVEGLTSLYFLSCTNNQLTTLNVQGLINLYNLNCDYNQLTDLNANGLSNLYSLDCTHNQLTSLSLHNLVSLQILSCNDNALMSVDFQGLTSLQNLNCDNNQLVDLNVQGLNSLWSLSCDKNKLVVLNLQGLSNLFKLYCNNNQLNMLVLNGLTNLNILKCNYNMLPALNFQGMNNLTTIECRSNQLVDLTVEGLTNLQNLFCDNNNLTSLNVKSATSLYILSCPSNVLTTLDVLGLSSLNELDCSSNSLMALDILGLIGLTSLNCYDNEIKSLDVQGAPNLEELKCSYNHLTKLTVQGLRFLKHLDCHNNLLSTLNVQGDTSLQDLYCLYNQLTSLFIKNGRKEGHLNFSNNPNLSYICCDPEQITDVYDQTLLNGQNNCTVSSACSVETFLHGVILSDPNLNCLQDNNETGLQKRILKAEKAGYDPVYAISNPSGQYEMGLDTGLYQVSTHLYNHYSEPCEDSVWVDLQQLNDTASLDFALQTLIYCPLMEVNIVSDRMRRCMNNRYVVQYCNAGTAPAPIAQVTVSLSEHVTFIGSSIPGFPVGGNQWRFSVGEVQPDECGAFTIDFYLKCDSTFIGQSVCASAHITPDSICTPAGSNWSGAQVAVDGYCEGDSVHFEVKNIGYGGMTATQTFFVIEDDVILFQTPFNLPAQASIIVKTPANGSSWRLEAEQEPTFPFMSMPYASIEGCGLNLSGLFSLGFMSQFSEQDGNPFYSRECREIVGSYDPNEKSAQPRGVGALHDIYPNTEIEYQINFQNTGTDTAFTVVIQDTLDQGLDPLTFRAGISSHPYQVEMTGQGNLVFSFNPIFLPDSNVNEPASHGFVRFRIRPKNTIALGTRIENRAGIYFDFNLPIITNTVFHTVDTGFLEIKPVRVQALSDAAALSFFPNPMCAGASLFFEQTEAAGQVTLRDPLGKIVLQSEISSNKIQIPEDLEVGVYFLEWSIGRGLKKWGKLVILK